MVFSGIPAIIYFLISFAVIVSFWIEHHDIFERAPEKVSGTFLWVNTALLATICLLPFGLEFFTANPTDYLTVGVYAGLMAIATLVLGALARLADGHWSPIHFVQAGVFLLAIPLADVAGSWCLLVWVLVAPIQRIRFLRRTSPDH